jgi:hypothetical protein
MVFNPKLFFKTLKLQFLFSSFHIVLRMFRALNKLCFARQLKIQRYSGHVCFPEFIFRETTFQTFLCLFAIRKVDQRKTLSG